MLKQSLSVLRYENCPNYASVLGTAVGESEKGLPMCVSVMVRYVLLKSIGRKLTGSVK